VINEPGSLICGHSFEESRIKEWYAKKGKVICPYCHTESSTIGKNIFLKNVLDRWKFLNLPTEEKQEQAEEVTLSKPEKKLEKEEKKTIDPQRLLMTKLTQVMSLIAQRRFQEAINLSLIYQKEYPNEVRFVQLVDCLLSGNSHQPQTIPLPSAQILQNSPAGGSNKPTKQTGQTAQPAVLAQARSRVVQAQNNDSHKPPQPMSYLINVPQNRVSNMPQMSTAGSPIMPPPISAEGAAGANSHLLSHLQSSCQHLSPRMTTSETSTFAKRKRETTGEDNQLSSEPKVVGKRRKIDLGENNLQITYENEEFEAVDEDQQTLATITTGTNNNDLLTSFNKALTLAKNKDFKNFKYSLNWQLVRFADTSGNTLLHELVEEDCLVRFIPLLISNGADPDAINFEGDTPLHCAARNGNRAIVVALLKCGAVRSIKNKEGKTPIDLTLVVKVRDLLGEPEKETST
jgi:ankyrin repeat protein